MALVIRESGLPLAVAGEAADGAALVERALALAPRIVVLEARLPERDGLAALRELRAAQPALQAIVLSRSHRFEDAARALELGATAYLLKPLEPDRLRAALRRAIAALERPVVAGPALPPLPAPRPGERVCAFTLPAYRDPQVDAVLRRLAQTGMAVTAGAGYAAVALGPDPDDLDRVLRARRTLPGPAKLGLSAPFDPAEPRPGVPDALRALAAGYFAAGEAVIHAETLPATDEPYPLAAEYRLSRAVTVGDLEAARDALRALTAALTQPTRSPESARNRFRDLIALLARVLAARPGAGPQALAWADRWSAAVTAADTAVAAADVLDRAWEDAAARLASAPSSSVARAQAFVRDNLSDPLAVADVAAAVGFHPDHLSHLFRRELGITVGGYLATCRLERAKQLLSTGAAPVAEVAAASGFRDPRYFSRAFRRATGLSPTDFRRRFAA